MLQEEAVYPQYSHMEYKYNSLYGGLKSVSTDLKAGLFFPVSKILAFFFVFFDINVHE